MGLETALRDYHAQGGKFFFDTGFCRGVMAIPINGLVWMGTLDFMQNQIREKITAGYRCLKLKIGALDFQAECALIREIRTEYSQEEMEIRVDANGAFSAEDAKGKLEALAALGIHSVEQPIQAGQCREMASLCRESPVPIALDEELIGIDNPAARKSLIHEIRSSYLVLKPSLHGGFSGCEDWIKLADRTGIGWWITSALESNNGLNAIAQWTSTLNNPLPQRLSSGELFENNFPAPLYIRDARLWMNRKGKFNLSGLYHG
ncbi:MAG TPA: o-succinylbenzoate synthase [Syntrophales bacterium]|nr:o-succinylbenzoate synthase [Syntrophales bacterium]